MSAGNETIRSARDLTTSRTGKSDGRPAAGSVDESESSPAVLPRTAAAAAGIRVAAMATVRDISRSHWAHLVEGQPRPVVVKQVRARLRRAGRTLAQEAFVYRLAAWMPPIATVLPHAYLIDERNGVLVLEALAAEPPR